jgi:hypothetical protein
MNQMRCWAFVVLLLVLGCPTVFLMVWPRSIQPTNRSLSLMLVAAFAPMVMICMAGVLAFALPVEWIWLSILVVFLAQLIRLWRWYVRL